MVIDFFFFPPLKNVGVGFKYLMVCYSCKHGAWHCEVSDDDACGLEEALKLVLRMLLSLSSSVLMPSLDHPLPICS